jgi:hypothetical protein
MPLADEGLKMAVDSGALVHHNMRLTGLTDSQDAEKVRQRRSRIV